MEIKHIFLLTDNKKSIHVSFFIAISIENPEILSRTVPVNNIYLTGTVPVNSM